MKLALQKAKVFGSELLNFNFLARAIGRKVVIIFDGTWSTITEDALRSLHTTLGMFSAANLNLTTSLKSFIDLFDLISEGKGSFANLFSQKAPNKGDFGSKKLMDFLLKGFTLHSKLTGNFSKKSAQEVFEIISKVFMPGYVKIVLDQILKFQDPANKSTLGETLCPSSGVAVKNLRITNFEKDLLTSGKLNGTFSDIFDLGDALGT